jgi:hypothetical protein
MKISKALKSNYNYNNKFISEILKNQESNNSQSQKTLLSKNKQKIKKIKDYF